MSDPTTTRTRMPPVALRISSSSAARVTMPRHAACVLDLLDHTCPPARAAMGLLI